MIASLRDGLEMFHTLAGAVPPPLGAVASDGRPLSALEAAALAAATELSTLRAVYREAGMRNHEGRVAASIRDLLEALNKSLSETAPTKLEEMH